jgi:hypothetical protein
MTKADAALKTKKSYHSIAVPMKLPQPTRRSSALEIVVGLDAAVSCITAFQIAFD